MGHGLAARAVAGAADPAADGTLRPGASGSFDARNFTVGTAPDGRPVFRPTSTAGADDYKWQDGFGLPEGVSSSPVGGNVKAVLQVGSDIYIGAYTVRVGAAGAAVGQQLVEE
ncbi:hypothetical protein [Hymenobacter negativus]|uniref:Uncharacterized protein n=1 Tax=Hymenobacter negativus TaxID=2795026 RepID=A0ABS3QML5_9BACT|nr:hypothetical protein [Hymenobacter negativus]MBO2012437.1 hypothetical protein [Hymenobacter negativus]